MRHFIYILILSISTGDLFSQTYPKLSFRKPTTSDNITWKFKSVAPGVDAFVTVVGSKNATLDKIDDSSKFVQAWNPFIKYTSTPSSSTDSSYMEFKIEFKKSSGASHTFPYLAMTAVDNDGGVNGSNVFREMVKTTLPATPQGFFGSSITSAANTSWLTSISGTVDYPTMDTTNLIAMLQLNYANISSYSMRVGVVGRVAGGTVRQASFYFKSFAPLNIVLPVKLLNLTAQVKNNANLIQWSSSSEENLNSFEVYSSLDGKIFNLAGSVKAAGNSQIISNYSFVDQHITENQENVYYKLRMVDNNGQYNWSSIVKVSKTTVAQSILGNVYPNPTHGELNLSFENTDSEFTIDVVNMLGKILKSYSNVDLNYNSTLTLDVNEFSAGIYFIKVTGLDGNGSTTRFIKN